MSEQMSHRYIAVEGPIGVGKTSLARRLAEQLGGELLLERPEENPFLRRFYENPKDGALPAQLFFLLQRSRQVSEVLQESLFSRVRIADFLIEKDPLFARVTLDDDELDLYENVYRTMAVSAPPPDLVIYLQAPVDVLLGRIAKRGIDYEQRGIDRDYLRRLNEAYMRFFHDYDRAPLLIVNAAEVNLAEGDEALALLLERIRSIRTGRHYFNPAPEIL